MARSRSPLAALAVVLLCSLLTGAMSARDLADSKILPQVIVVVRHAEVVIDGSSDPPLSESGRARAQLLARIAAAFDVDAAFVTPFRRTTNTALPTAERLGLKPETVPISGTNIPGHVSDLVGRIHAGSGSSTLVVGHSNTVPALIQAMTGVVVGPIAEDQFNRLFIIRYSVDGIPTLEERTY